MIRKIKYLISRIKRKIAINRIRESFYLLGYDVDRFDNDEIEMAFRRMAREIFPATSFSASEVAGALRNFGKAAINCQNAIRN